MNSPKFTSKVTAQKNKIHVIFNPFLFEILNPELSHSQSYSHYPTNSSMKPFDSVPTIGTKSMTKPLQWQESMKKLVLSKKKNRLEHDFYYCHGSDGVHITAEIVKIFNEQMQAANWSSFDAFIDCSFGILKITCAIDWLSGSCSCPSYMNEYACKHLISIAIFTNKLILLN